MLAFAGVGEVAAVGVPSPDGEEEVLVAVAPTAGRASIRPRWCASSYRACRTSWCRATCASSDELPKTPTQKVHKHLLRTEGVTADTWDRAAAGIEVKRERIGATTAPGEERRAR